VSVQVFAQDAESGAELATDAIYGHRIKGPSALGSNPRRLWQLTWALAKTEFKLAYFGSVLGYLWQLMRPLMLFGVIFGVIYAVDNKIGSGVPFFPVSVLLGIVSFNFLSESSGGAVASLINRENLVRKIEFPRLAVPLSIVITALMNYSLNLIPVVAFLLATGGAVRLSWLEMPVLIVLFMLFCGGLATVLSASYVRYRDVRPIWEVVLQMIFYASPIFYPITKIDKPYDILGLHINIAHVLMLNPFVSILVQARHVLIDPRYPSAAQAIGGYGMLMIPIGIALAVILFGFFVFDRQAPKIAERL
jgi:ABC-2 type transport system permease protein